MTHIKYLIEINPPVKWRTDQRAQDMFVTTTTDSLIRIHEHHILHDGITTKPDGKRIADDGRRVLFGYQMFISRNAVECSE